MTTKLVRITTVAEDILRVYSGKDSLSRGVIAMQGILQEKDREISRLKDISDDLQKKVLAQSKVMWQSSPCMHDERYWGDMEKLLLRVNQSISEYRIKSGFQPAGKLVVTPVKTIGKIDEDEKLVEPVGRQGRDVR